MSEGKLGRIWLATRDGRLPGRVREVQYDRILFQIEAPIQAADVIEFKLELPDLSPMLTGQVVVMRVLATPEGQPAIYLAEFEAVPHGDRERLDLWLDERTAIGALADMPPGARDYDDLEDDVATNLDVISRRAGTGDSSVSDPPQGGRTAIANALRKGVRRSARTLKDGMGKKGLPDWMHDSDVDFE